MINALIVYLLQIAFLFFRTLNIKATARNHVLGAILSGVGIGFCWLLSIKLSIDALRSGDWMTIAGYFLGGATGTYIGMKMKPRKKKSNADSQSG